MAKSFDPKAKAKRQKIIAAAGGVLLLGLLAFQVPRTMKMLHPSNASASSDSAPAITTGVTSGPIAAPSLSGGNATASASGVTSGGLSDPNAVSTANSGQLLAFSRFRTKDPFSQQINVNCASRTPARRTRARRRAVPRARPRAPSTGSTTPPSTGSQGGATTTPGSVAGEADDRGDLGERRIGRGQGGRHSSRPRARHSCSISLTKTTAKIGIAGGSLEGKKQTVTLKKGVPLTLMNTADGTRYVLRLVSVS